MNDLRNVPGIGKKTQLDLQKLGITCLDDLRNVVPEELYEKDCKLQGIKIDRCQLYVYRCAVYYANHREEKDLRWWDFKDEKLSNIN